MTCLRAPLVETMFDARLGETTHASMGRHLASCAECAAELRALGELRSDVRALPNAITELAHQRVRLELLRRAANPTVARRGRPTLLLAFALVLVPVAVWAGATAKTPPPPLAKHVERVEAPIVVPVVVAPPPRSSPIVVPTATRPPPSPPPLPEKPKPRPVREFADGMDAVSRGDFGAGAAKLAQFAAEHPSDPRAEEAIYVEAIALERAGRIPEAQTVARRYLALYSDGAHTTKIRRLAKE